MAPNKSAKTIFEEFLVLFKNGTATVNDAERTWKAIKDIIYETCMRHQELSAVSSEITDEMEQLRQENNSARSCLFSMYDHYQDVLNPGCLLKRTWSTLPMLYAIDPDYFG